MKKFFIVNILKNHVFLAFLFGMVISRVVKEYYYRFYQNYYFDFFPLFLAGIVLIVKKIYQIKIERRYK